jgi:hypothetical protein
MLRRLLNIASIVCLMLCVALMGMWVRSYWWLDNWKFSPLSACRVGIASANGRIAIRAGFENPKPSDTVFKLTQYRVGDRTTDLARIDQHYSAVAGFGFLRNGGLRFFMFPYWSIVLLIGGLSFLPWSRVKYRFSVRTLLIATTFLAVVLGMIAWLDRAWIGK